MWPAPTGGQVGFSSSLQHCLVPSSWSTWSHGYAGDVYFSGYEDSSITLTMPARTKAFYLYAEPNPFEPWRITATGADGSTTTIAVSQMVDGYGWSRLLRFLVPMTLSPRSRIDYEGCKGFAVGEFGIFSAIPAPGGDRARGDWSGSFEPVAESPVALMQSDRRLDRGLWTEMPTAPSVFAIEGIGPPPMPAFHEAARGNHTSRAAGRKWLGESAIHSIVQPDHPMD